MAHPANQILQAMPVNERGILGPLLKSRTLNQHTVLFEAQQVIECVYFPFGAVVSLVVPLSSGKMIQAAIVGHDGVVGAAAAVNGRVALNRGVAQVGGGCQCCDVNALRKILPQCPTLFGLIHRHEQAVFAQAQQSAACNVSHSVNCRLARWLLRARDLRGGDELDLTQEYMAETLGVRRTTVSLSAHTLQQAGLLSYRRGRITIKNVEGLKDVSCECYEAVKLHYATLGIAALTDSSVRAFAMSGA